MIHQTLRLELRIAAIYKGLARFSSGVDSCLCSRRCRQIAISPVLTLRYLSEGWNPVSIQHDMCICSGPRRTMQNKHQIVADRDPTIIGRESVSSCYFLLDRYPLWIDQSRQVHICSHGSLEQNQTFQKNMNRTKHLKNMNRTKLKKKTYETMNLVTSFQVITLKCRNQGTDRSEV